MNARERNPVVEITKCLVVLKKRLVFYIYMVIFANFTLA